MRLIKPWLSFDADMGRKFNFLPHFGLSHFAGNTLEVWQGLTGHWQKSFRYRLRRTKGNEVLLNQLSRKRKEGGRRWMMGTREWGKL
jgi:hypothetical protein